MKKNILQLHKGIMTKDIVTNTKDNTRLHEQRVFNSATASSLELGASIALPIAGGALLGNYIDHQFLTSPKWMLSFLFLGVIIGSIQIIKLAFGQKNQ